MIDIVDFHSHILPGADHGSGSVSESLDQLRLASDRGIKRIIATPHFYPNSHDVNSFINRRDLSYNQLLAAMTDGSPEIKLGAEVLICEGIENMPGLESLFIAGTSTLLLELSYTDFHYSYIKSVAALISSGVDVILAHADRYPKENVKQLIDVGARIQLNADSCKSIFLPKHIKQWLDSGRVVALGSDIHGRDHKAYRNFCAAVAKISKYVDSIKASSDDIWNKAEK